ncbi:MAG: hypothetical protein JRE24_01710 [Deltaproteobacteria bacterium]|nr:hypothetical protein [Deltaproteobacteria bacterium]
MTIAFSIAAIVASFGILLLGVSAARFIQAYSTLVEQVQEVLKGAVQEMTKTKGQVPDFLPDWLKE